MDALVPDRVIFVLNSLRIGGSQSVYMQLARIAAGAGYDVTVASRGGPLAERFRESGARVTTLLMREGVALSDGTCAGAAKTVVSFATVLQLLRERTNPCTILHASQPWPVGLASLAAQVGGMPLVWHAHGTSAVEMPPAMPDRVRRRSSAWVGITPEVTDALRGLRPSDATQVLTIPNPVALGVDDEPRSRVPGTIGALCTLTANKMGYLLACIAAAQEFARYRNAPTRLCIVGDGPMREKVRDAGLAAQEACPALTVRLVGSSTDPWGELSACEVIAAMGAAAVEGAARGHNVVCASSEGLGGHLTVGSWDLLSRTNFTGRGVAPLSVAALALDLRHAVAHGVDGQVGGLARRVHGQQAAAQWVGLWRGIADGAVSRGVIQ